MISYFNKDGDKIFELKEYEDVEQNIKRICKNVYGVEFVGHVQTIPDYAFMDCINLENLSLPDSVRQIGDYAFRGCELLEIKKIPQRVKKIGDYAFSYTKIKTAELQPCMDYIGRGAFKYCLELETVILPFIRNIEYETFAHCHKLSKVVIRDETTIIKSKAFECCDSLENINLPDSVETIEDFAFVGCTKLKSIALPKSVKCIDVETFKDCKSLEMINLDSIVEIKRNAFKNCCSLSSVSYNNVLKTEIVGESAFSGCKKLTSLALPNVKKIGNTAFKNCYTIRLKLNKKAILCLFINHDYCIEKSINEVLKETKSSNHPNENLKSILIPHNSPLYDPTIKDLNFSISFYA